VIPAVGQRLNNRLQIAVILPFHWRKGQKAPISVLIVGLIQCPKEKALSKLRPWTSQLHWPAWFSLLKTRW
jgi:hypothetical protein